MVWVLSAYRENNVLNYFIIMVARCMICSASLMFMQNTTVIIFYCFSFFAGSRFALHPGKKKQVISFTSRFFSLLSFSLHVGRGRMISRHQTVSAVLFVLVVCGYLERFVDQFVVVFHCTLTH